MNPAGASDVRHLDYRLRWRASELRPGKHLARHSGSGGAVQSIRPFWQLPDAQRIDIRRSIVDPFGGVMVRQTEQRSSIAVAVAVDVSRSMQPTPARSTFDSIAAIAEAAARSALRAGDSFSLLSFDRTLHAGLSLSPSRSRLAAEHAAEQLRTLRATGTSAVGLAELAAQLPSRRTLLILISDFRMPLDQLEAGLLSLARHDIAPVVVTEDPAATMPAYGLVRLGDVETGRRRLLLMRPALRRRWQQTEARRRAALDDLFRQHTRPPFHAGRAIDLAALSEHLLDA